MSSVFLHPWPRSFEMHAIIPPEGSRGLPAFFGEFFHDFERHIGYEGPGIFEGVVVGIEVDGGSPGVDGEAGAAALVPEIVYSAVVFGGLHDLAGACAALADGGEDA